MQDVAASHETPLSVLDVAPDGEEIVSSAQDLPFHCSTRACDSFPVPTYEPTAMQEVFETHETPSKSFEVDPAGTTGVC